MSRIIKLTESQLRDMVAKTIEEQSAVPDFGGAASAIGKSLGLTRDDRPKGTLVDQIYNEFVAGGTGAKATSHTVMASAINKIPDYKTLIALNNMIKAKTPGGFKSLVQCLQGWLKVGEENIFKNIQAKLKTLGVNLIINNPSGIFKPADIRIAKGQVKTNQPQKTDPNKPTYRECSGFPIKYGCKQTEVGRLQQCLGLKVDYSFGPNTLKALVNYIPNQTSAASAALQKQYVEIGVSKGAYDLMLQKCKKAPVKAKAKTAVPAPAPVVDTRDKTAPTTLASKQIQQLPVNIDVANALQNLPAPGVDNARKLAILGQIKDRGFDQVYKGQKLTDAEQQWLSSYMGGEASKEKQKAGGNEKLVFPNR
jgi:hypothetical protein